MVNVVTCKSLLDNTCYSSEFSGDIMVGCTVRIVQCFMWNLTQKTQNYIIVACTKLYT